MGVVTGPPSVRFKAPPPEATLRKLFMTIFLRGRSFRFQTKQTTPKSLSSKLWMILLIYGALGGMAVFMLEQPVVLISLMLHSMTFLMLGMFLASAAGEVLFNKEEAEILMHRPVTSQMLLRAKATVLVQVSLYLAGAMNFVGLFVGALVAPRGWLFPIAHALSSAEEAVFCIGIIVLAYQLCLRWVGRERLEGVMTTMQVLVVVTMTVGTQLLPRALAWNHGLGRVNVNAWWLKLLPPTWFAGLDDAMAGSGSSGSWILAALGLAVTGAIAWFAFGRLAAVYEEGVQNLNESTRPRKKEHSQSRFLRRLAGTVPVCWFLRDSVSRAAFQLVAAYMLRDRDTKLRVYPAVAPSLSMMVVLLVSDRGFSFHQSRPVLGSAFGAFGVAFSAVFLCMLPISVLTLIKYSQQWRASEVFISAPIIGPDKIMQGARVAVVVLICLPALLIFIPMAAVLQGASSLWLVLPGIFVLPVYTLLPGVMASGTPLSNPIEEAQSAANLPMTMLALFVSMVIAGVATAASAMHLLPQFLSIEAFGSLIARVLLRKAVAKAPWRTYD